MIVTKGTLIVEGKTKRLFEVKEDPGLLIVENKADITAFDDPAYTQQIPAKAKYATQTTCGIFEMLHACGLPVAYAAYVRQPSETEFVAPKVTMIPLEVVTRRLAVGSFLERRPDYCQEGRPLRFHRLKTEFFLKTTRGKITIEGKEHDLGLPLIPGKEGDKPLDDPLIQYPFSTSWELYHPKKPSWDKTAKLGRQFDPFRFSSLLEEMDKINRQAFLLIEAFWANLGFVLVDWKIEFGTIADGLLVIADVIDNDSWRLRDPEFKEVSKQVFRDGGQLDEVESKYGYVASMVSQFRLPKQALVIWKGSKDDKSPEVPNIAGVEKVEIVLSGHKQTQSCLKKLEELQRDYPDGGVIIAVVGMSNGLGPVLSSHSVWPVVGVPLTAKEFPDDVWSSLRLPSQNPMATVLSDKNAVLFALNILGLKNPAAYMERQFALEQLDTVY